MLNTIHITQEGKTYFSQCNRILEELYGIPHVTVCLKGRGDFHYGFADCKSLTWRPNIEQWELVVEYPPEWFYIPPFLKEDVALEFAILHPQVYTPDLFHPATLKSFMFEKLKAWAPTHVHVRKDGLELEDGDGHYILDCKNVVLKGSTRVCALCDSHVKSISEQALVEYASNSTFDNIENDEDIHRYFYEIYDITYRGKLIRW